ncbi:MAG TPA: lysozyme inhibitor LprI family protein [Rhizomicrobium sp.]|nr:lysozyme inhibitor LprI family protein [Rhizomicrobium sp.]
MKTCENCGKVFADKFTSCPNCNSKKIGKGCLIVVVLFLGVGAIASLLPGDNKSAQPSADSGSTTTQAANEDLNHCVNRNVRTGQYSSLDGGKSAMAIMAACEDQIKKEQPACFANDPKDNEVDNQKQMSPGASCRFAAVAAIQLTLKAYEGGIPLSDESKPGVEKQPENSAGANPNSAPAAEVPSAGTAQATPTPNESSERVEPPSTSANTPASTATEGPSFDCSRVTSEVLNLVCKTPELALADRQLAEAYKAARARSTTPDYLVRTQRQWIQDRTNSPAEVPYLLRMYRERIDYLNAL